MKNNYGKLTGFGWLIMLVSAVSLAFFSQAQTVSPPQIQWQRTIEKNPLLPTGYSSTNDMPVRVAKIGDQEYGVLTSGAELVRLSSTGNPIWSTLIVDANSGYFRTDGVIATQDGGFMVLALTTGNWRLIKYNANGVVEKTYSPFSIGNRRQYSTTRSNLITTSDNGILVLGNRWDMLEGQITVVVAKFDSNISQSWETEISFPIPNPPVESKDYTNSVKALNTPDGGYLLVGSNGRTVNGPTAGWAVKLNGQGNQVWQKRYEDISAIDDVIPSPFSVDTYITIGRGANDPSLTQITTINSNGNVVEKSTYPGRATGTSSALVAVPARNGVPAYLTLMDVSSQNNGDIRLTAINAQNEVSWTKTLGGSGKEKGQAILATDDGGYIAVGTTTSTDGDVTGKTTSDEATWVVKLSAPVSTPTSTLKLTQPTYNCNTGIITFNTSGGDGSPITYTAPGITRSSPTSNTGVIEQGLRNDPKSITIQATQHGYTTSYIFDLKASCTFNNGPYPPVLATPIQNLTLTVGQSLDRYRVNFNFKDPNSHHGTSFYLLSFEATNTPPGLYFFDDTDSGTGIGDAYFTGTPTKPGTYLITVTAYFFRYTTSSISTSGTFTITVIDPSVNPPTGGDLKLTQPTYDCATGAITFNTTGGDGSPITYSAPGITRSSASSNTGVVEQGLRNDPKPITITATQNAKTISYVFNLELASLNCVNGFKPPVQVKPIPDLTFTVGQVVTNSDFTLNDYFVDPSNKPPHYFSNWTASLKGLPNGMHQYTANGGDLRNALDVYLQGSPTIAGVYTVTATVSLSRFPGQPISSTFKITVTDKPIINPPNEGTLTLTQPTYDCATGAITFKTTGGDGSPIEFRAIGITDWTTNPSQFIDRESRTASDVQPFTLMARQSGQVVTYTWDLKAACGRARVGAIEVGQAFSLQLLGNPVQDQVNVQIRGAEGQSVQLRLTDLQGRLLESRTIEQAKPVEEQQFWLHASAPKLLLLQAATPQQVQTVKIIKQ